VGLDLLAPHPEPLGERPADAVDVDADGAVDPPAGDGSVVAEPEWDLDLELLGRQLHDGLLLDGRVEHLVCGVEPGVPLLRVTHTRVVGPVRQNSCRG
jgi:hypothetical protein